MQKFITTLSNIFTPIIPAIFIAGILSAMINLGVSITYFSDISTIIFYTIPVLLGYSSAKVFEVKEYLGILLGLILISDSTLKYGVDYKYSVLPIIFSVYLLSKLIKIDKRIPSIFPFIITCIITLKILGPVTMYISSFIGNSIMHIYNNFGLLGGGILGLFYAPIVIIGIHHIFLPIELDLIKHTGSFITPIAAISNIAQSGAVLGVLIYKKKYNDKNVLGAFLSALLGITEPAVFTVNLKYKYPFYASCIASMLSSIYLGIVKMLSISIGVTGIFSYVVLPKYQWFNFSVGILISFFISFILTIIFLKRFKV